MSPKGRKLPVDEFPKAEISRMFLLQMRQEPAMVGNGAIVFDDCVTRPACGKVPSGMAVSR